MSKGLKALERLMADYYEMCQDLGNNDDQYQRCNLTSERAIIEKELKAFEIITRKLNVEIEEDKGTYFLCITGWYIEIPKKEYALLKEVIL